MRCCCVVLFGLCVCVVAGCLCDIVMCGWSRIVWCCCVVFRFGLVCRGVVRFGLSMSGLLLCVVVVF